MFWCWRYRCSSDLAESIRLAVIDWLNVTRTGGVLLLERKRLKVKAEFGALQKWRIVRIKELRCIDGSTPLMRMLFER